MQTIYIVRNLNIHLADGRESCPCEKEHQGNSEKAAAPHHGTGRMLFTAGITETPCAEQPLSEINMDNNNMTISG